MNLWLNRLAPDFTLPLVGGGRFSLSEWRGFIVVINFWSAECVWSRRADVLLVYRMLTWHGRGVRAVGLACNNHETETEVRHEIKRRQIQYPIAVDYDHRIADLYKAETTPHFFVLDRQGTTRYVGALDDSGSPDRAVPPTVAATPGGTAPTGGTGPTPSAAPRAAARTFYLDQAVAALLEDRMPDPAYTPAYGCPIVRRQKATSAFTSSF